MNVIKPCRVMWLLNHTSARKFEIPMLKKLGFSEIYLPKKIPESLQYRSASVDYSEDANLTIPQEDLAILNEIDWYENPTKQAIEIANKYFDIAFFIGKAPIIKALTHYFKGTLIYRAYGLAKHETYANVIQSITNNLGSKWLRDVGNRFYFGQVFKEIIDVEPDYISKRAIFLPLGIPQQTLTSNWTGNNKSIFFICPDVVFNEYYRDILKKFKKDFYDFQYTIGGSQLIMPSDSTNILGFVTREHHERNMREMRVMFYHSSEPRHIHYHPLEAIQAGMPLIFMAGGVLDRWGGESLPGRCKTIKEARAKIKRIFNDDWPFINEIIKSQPVILESITNERCEQEWKTSFEKIANDQSYESEIRPITTLPKRPKVAVILPVGYRGGSLRGAKLLAQAIYQGSQQNNELVDVVFFHLDDPETYTDDSFSDLYPGVAKRSFKWKEFSAAQATRAMHFAGYSDWQPDTYKYLAPDDGINQLTDCALWIVVSDRVLRPILPIRPCIHVVYDYIQRYIPLFPANNIDLPFINAARDASLILVTTKFTQQDVIQYAGLPSNKVIKVPMLTAFFDEEPPVSDEQAQYFIWTTNLGIHKNLENAFKALKIYYEHMEGTLLCYITGVNTEHLLDNSNPKFEKIRKIIASNLLKKNLSVLGELDEIDYKKTMAKAAFVWHAGIVDNGNFSVIEGASLGVPSLSSDYPPMREINDEFSLSLSWMDGNNPYSMAEQLKEMELSYKDKRKTLPGFETLAQKKVEAVAGEYWKVIRECL